MAIAFEWDDALVHIIPNCKPLRKYLKKYGKYSNHILFIPKNKFIKEVYGPDTTIFLFPAAINTLKYILVETNQKVCIFTKNEDIFQSLIKETINEIPPLKNIIDKLGERWLGVYTTSKDYKTPQELKKKRKDSGPLKDIVLIDTYNGDRENIKHFKKSGGSAFSISFPYHLSRVPTSEDVSFLVDAWEREASTHGPVYDQDFIEIVTKEGTIGNEVLDKNTGLKRGKVTIRLAVKSDLLGVVRNALASHAGSYKPDIEKRYLGSFVDNVTENVKSDLLDGRMIIATDGKKVISQGVFYKNKVVFVQTIPEYRGHEYKFYPTMMAILFSLCTYSNKWKNTNELKADIDTGSWGWKKLMKSLERIAGDLKLIVAEKKYRSEYQWFTFKTNNPENFNNNVITFLTEKLGWEQIRLKN